MPDNDNTDFAALCARLRELLASRMPPDKFNKSRDATVVAREVNIIDSCMNALPALLDRIEALEDLRDKVLARHSVYQGKDLNPWGDGGVVQVCSCCMKSAPTEAEIKHSDSCLYDAARALGGE